MKEKSNFYGESKCLPKQADRSKMRSSYLTEDVVLLLKDITGSVQPQSTEEREKLIQSGRHYSEMLPVEYVPTEKYMAIYREALDRYAKQVADAVAVLSGRIMETRGENVVLVSLARAGTPIGILIKRYMKRKYKTDVPHYSISIIRGRGIDGNAMQYLLDRYRPEQLLFVDGWIGKGAILRELEKDIRAYPHVSPEIAVVADPAGVTELCGTHEDILIPSSCLNSTVSGLISRTFLRDDIIGKKDFHGAVYYGELKDFDLSYEFIETIEKNFILDDMSDDLKTEIAKPKESLGLKQKNDIITEFDGAKKNEIQKDGEITRPEKKGIDEVREIAASFEIEDINFIKPGIGETTRVLLRRVPWKVLIDERYKEDPELSHVVRLAEEKNVPVEYYPLTRYKCCGIIKRVADI